MRFFTDGHTVIRVHTAAQLGDRQEFLNATAETFQFRSGVWAEKPNLTSRIVFTGDWQPCDQEEAEKVVAAARAMIETR